MYVPDELKLNRFVNVPIPENRDYFARFGTSKVAQDAAYTGDSDAPLPKSKIDAISDMDRYDRMMQEEESRKNGSE